MKHFKLFTMLALYLGFIAEIIAQSAGISSIPSDVRFFESYKVVETLEFLIPNDSLADKMTPMDWVNFKPKKEVKIRKAYIDANYDRFTEIEILESNHANEWDYQIENVEIGPLGTKLFDKGGKLILNAEKHPDELIQYAQFTQSLKDSGLFPEQLPSFNELEHDASLLSNYNIVQTPNGYRLTNSEWEITVNHQTHTLKEKALIEVEGEAYYRLKKYVPNALGYLMPLYTEERSTLISESGHRVIKLERKNYSNTVIHYHPSILASNKIALASQFSISPNPASSYLLINYTGFDSNQNYSVQILNQVNDFLLSQNNLSASQTEIIDIGALPSGFYVIRFSVNDQFFSKKFFKN